MKLLLIDGNSIMNRAFYGIRMLTSPKGVPTNALTGFMNIYMKLLKEERPDRICAAFDLKAPTFRHKLYAEYKGTRHAMPDELAAQMPIIKDILRALGVTITEVEGYEADDIIGTLSRAAYDQGAECVIMTGDRDSFQLVNDKVTVRLASNKEDVFYTPEKIREAYGVEPREMLEVKALMGDSSDNIPGVAGIGEKTALGLVQKYHNIQYIFDNLQQIDIAKGVRTKLENGRESAELSRTLGEICLTAPVSENFDDYEIKNGDKSTVVGILQELGMNSAIKKLGLDGVQGTKTEIKTPTKSANTNGAAPKSEVVADTTPYDKNALNVIVLNGEIAAFRDTERIEGDLKPLLESEEPIHTDNAKAFFTECIKLEIEPKNVTFDMTLAAYLLDVNASNYDMERLCGKYSIDLDKNEPVKALILLNKALYNDICSQGMLKVLREIELPLSEVLASMEHEGIALDSEGLAKFGEEILPKIAELEKDVCDIAGHKFNIGSPKQLSVVLFEELSLPAGKKRKTGYSTDSETLEELIDKSPIIKPILEYRKLTKLYNTYVKGLQNAVSEDGRMYTTFKQTETRTGRISSAEPNIQNIPVRTELGRNFRKFLIAGEGKVLCDADYSQIELRVLASLSNDKVMIETFKEGRDIHAETAESVFRKTAGQSDPDLRRKAKAVNFGIVYGIGAFSLAKDIGTTVGDAKRYIDDYLTHFSGVKQYMDTNTQSAETDGYAVTMFGRRRFIPEILSTNKVVKALGKRIAMNTPIQGTAADIIKIAMIRVYRRLKKELPQAKLILQVHDELIVEAPKAVSEQALRILKEEMQSAVELSVPVTGERLELSVPLLVDAKCGKTWFETH